MYQLNMCFQCSDASVKHVYSSVMQSLHSVYTQSSLLCINSWILNECWCFCVWLFGLISITTNAQFSKKEKKMHKFPQDRPYTILRDNRKKNSRTRLGVLGTVVALNTTALWHLGLNLKNDERIFSEDHMLTEGNQSHTAINFYVNYAQYQKRGLKIILTYCLSDAAPQPSFSLRERTSVSRF